MIYKAVSPAELKPGDLIRRRGSILTVASVVPDQAPGHFRLSFKEGETVSVVGAVTLVDPRGMDAPLAM